MRIRRAHVLVGGTGGNRTRDRQLKRLLLYRLSYRPKYYLRRDINNDCLQTQVFFNQKCLFSLALLLRKLILRIAFSLQRLICLVRQYVN